MKQRQLQVLAGLALPLILAAALASPAGASTVSQTYSCTTPAGTQTPTATIVGTATKTTTQISLAGVKFTVKNTFPAPIVIKNIKVRVPDPNNTSAPYINLSAKVLTTPAGWTAGHDLTPVKDVFALHAGSISLAANASTTTAALSAKYTIKGPKGTVISFVGGTITFTVVSPIAGIATCTPSGTKKVFATVTE